MTKLPWHLHGALETGQWFKSSIWDGFFSAWKHKLKVDTNKVLSFIFPSLPIPFFPWLTRGTFWFFTPLSVLDDWQINELLKVGLKGRNRVPLHSLYLAPGPQMHRYPGAHKPKNKNCWYQRLSWLCVSSFLLNKYMCSFQTCARESVWQRLASLFSCFCFPGKVLLCHVVYCLKEIFLFFKTRAYFLSLSLSYLAGNTVELLLSTPGYEAAVRYKRRQDKGLLHI